VPARWLLTDRADGANIPAPSILDELEKNNRILSAEVAELRNLRDNAYCLRCGSSALGVGFQVEAETSNDRVCQEEDGCPTELAVLQRFWRSKQSPSEPERQV